MVNIFVLLIIFLLIFINIQAIRIGIETIELYWYLSAKLEIKGKPSLIKPNKTGIDKLVIIQITAIER